MRVRTALALRQDFIRTYLERDIPQFGPRVPAETLIAACHGAGVSFYRTSAGSEIDLVLDLGGRSGRWVVEIKRGLSPKVSKGLRNSITDLCPARAFIVYSGDETYPVARDIDAIGLSSLALLLSSL